MARIRRGELVHCSGFRVNITEWLLGARVPGVTRALVLPLRRELTVGQRCWVAGGELARPAACVCVLPSGARKCPALGQSVLRLVGLDYQLDTFSIRTGRQGNQIKTCLKGVAHKIVFLPLSLHIECVQVSRLSLGIFCQVTLVAGTEASNHRVSSGRLFHWLPKGCFFSNHGGCIHMLISSAAASPTLR
jgi:hypothetical protein